MQERINKMTKNVTISWEPDKEDKDLKYLNMNEKKKGFAGLVDKFKTYLSK